MIHYKLSALLVFCLSLSAQAQDCISGDATQTDMNRCSNQAYNQADAALNENFKVIMVCLRSIPGADKPLLEAQRAWIRFRDAECKFQGSANMGRSVQPMAAARCLETLTVRRKNELDYYLTCQEGDLSCPTATCRKQPPTRTEPTRSKIREYGRAINTPYGVALDNSFLAVDLKSSQSTLSSMQRAANNARYDGQIRSCYSMIAISVGVTGGNSSYAGFCQVTNDAKEFTAKVCYDKLVGHFYVEQVEGTELTKNSLVQFIGDHCWGG